MKKIIIAIAVALLIVGCRNTCILHTYYGDFDTDTLKSCLDDTDGISCYLVHTESSDTFRAKQGTIYIKGPVEVYYNPKKGCYYKRYPISGRGTRILMYNPTDNSYGE